MQEKIPTLEKNITVQEAKDASQKEITLKTLTGSNFKVKPYFEITPDHDIECQVVRFKTDIDGVSKEWKLHYLDLLMFCMAIGNEEHLRKLQNIQTRQVREIPYDVVINIRPEEKGLPKLKRRITLTVDELICAFAEQQAVKHNLKRNK